MTMFSVFVEVEPSPLAETTVVREEDVADWFKEKFELYKNVPGEIIFKAQKLEDKGVDPDWGEEEASAHYNEFTGFDDIPEPPPLQPLWSESFDYRIAGICDRYPALSVAEVDHARTHVLVNQEYASVIVQLDAGTHADGIEYNTSCWKATLLSAEYAYVLYMKLRNILFGSSSDSGFTSKP